MIRLDYRDARPIYEQVKDGLRRLMVTGVLAPGEKLPSVRSRDVEDKVRPLLQELRELGMTEGEWIALWRGGNENA